MDISKQQSVSDDGYNQVQLDRTLLENSGVLAMLNEAFFFPNKMRLYFKLDAANKPVLYIMYLDLNDERAFAYDGPASVNQHNKWVDFCQSLRG